MKPVPIPDNPQHIMNLSSIALMKAQGFVGSDACLATSLFDYGLVWRELPEGEILFIYRHPTLDGRFDRSTFDRDLDVQQEFDWVRWKELYEWADVMAEEWQAMPLPLKINDLLRFHGPENVFGSSYWEGFEVAE